MPIVYEYVRRPRALRTPQAFTQGTGFVVVWPSSSFLQLVQPNVIVGQNTHAAAAHKRSEDTYKDAAAVLKESEDIQTHPLV
jgi:hypothetical protein